MAQGQEKGGREGQELCDGKKSEGDYDGKELRKKVSFSSEWNASSLRTGVAEVSPCKCVIT